jgi:prepilin-type N-terminal cleavage/methylation domain-containing protein
MSPRTQRRSLNSRDTARRVLVDQRGLTLLETVVALAILTIGISAVLQVFSSGVAATKASEFHSTASILANQAASELDRQTDIQPGMVSGAFEDAPGYSWDANIEPPDGNGLMRTTVAVHWDVDGRPRRFDMVVCLRSQSGQETSSEPVERE